MAGLALVHRWSLGTCPKAVAGPLGLWGGSGRAVEPWQALQEGLGHTGSLGSDQFKSSSTTNKLGGLDRFLVSLILSFITVLTHGVMMAST